MLQHVSFFFVLVSQQWIEFEFKKDKIIPTSFSLKHHDESGDECLRNWDFEAFMSDEKKWIKLYSCQNNQIIEGKKWGDD